VFINAEAAQRKARLSREDAGSALMNTMGR